MVATGNHFVFDAAAGLVVTLAGFTAGLVLPRLAHRFTQDPILAAAH